jgi:hypothetical protein
MLNRKVCEGKGSWPNLKSYVSISLQRPRKTTKNSVITVGVGAKFRNERLTNTSQKSYNLSQPVLLLSSETHVDSKQRIFCKPPH